MRKFDYHSGYYALTTEDLAVLLRALNRGMGSVNTLMPMMRDEHADSLVMENRELAKVLDAEYQNYCLTEEQMYDADMADYRAMNGIC